MKRFKVGFIDSHNVGKKVERYVYADKAEQAVYDIYYNFSVESILFVKQEDVNDEIRIEIDVLPCASGSALGNIVSEFLEKGLSLVTDREKKIVFVVECSDVPHSGALAAFLSDVYELKEKFPNVTFEKKG